MKLFQAALLIVFLLGVNTAHAASKEECELLWGINPNVVCDASTPISDLDRSLGITSQVAKAKQYLLSIARDLRGSKAPPTCEQNIYRLNNTFSVCSAHFLKAYQSVYGEGSVYVVSAFRPPEDLGDGCGSNKAAGGAEHSNHIYGRAMDVAPAGRDSSYKTLQSFARENPQFGVCFPYLPEYTGGSFYDAPHMALAGIGTGEARRCALQGVTSYCDGSPKFDPNQINPEHANVVETEIYGDSVEYDQSIDSGRNSIFPEGNSQITDPAEETDYEYLSFVGGDHDFFDFIYDNEPTTELVYDTNSNVEQTFVLGSDGVGFVPNSVGDDNVVGCSGLFGTSLFNTCGDTKPTQSSFWKSPITSISKSLSFTDTEDSGTIIGGSSTNGVFDVHNPTDSASMVDDFYLNSGTFSKGSVEIDTSENLGVVDAAGKSVQYGTYYGVRDAMSPLLFGGAYRAAFRFETLKRIYNPFLLKSL